MIEILINFTSRQHVFAVFQIASNSLEKFTLKKGSRKSSTHVFLLDNIKNENMSIYIHSTIKQIPINFLLLLIGEVKKNTK